MKISEIERDSVEVMECDNSIDDHIFSKDKGRRYTLVMSNENMSIIRDGISYHMFSAGFIAREIMDKGDRLILEFDEDKIKKKLGIRGFMRIICIIARR